MSSTKYDFKYGGNFLIVYNKLAFAASVYDDDASEYISGYVRYAQQ